MTYRKFPSHYGLNRPTSSPGWIGYTVALRVGLLVVVLLTLILR